MIAECHVVAVFVLLAYTISLGSYVPAPGALALPIELGGAAVSPQVLIENCIDETERRTCYLFEAPVEAAQQDTESTADSSANGRSNSAIRTGKSHVGSC